MNDQRENGVVGCRDWVGCVLRSLLFSASAPKIGRGFVDDEGTSRETRKKEVVNWNEEDDAIVSIMHALHAVFLNGRNHTFQKKVPFPCVGIEACLTTRTRVLLLETASMYYVYYR
jgi:hypothetical protein